MMGRDPAKRTFNQAARNYDKIKTYDLLWRHEKFAAFHARK